MQLTMEMIQKASTSDKHIVLTNKSLAVLGLSYPLEKGWIAKLIGSEISQDQYNEFVKGKHESKALIKKQRELEIEKKNRIAIHNNTFPKVTKFCICSYSGYCNEKLSTAGYKHDQVVDGEDIMEAARKIYQSGLNVMLKHRHDGELPILFVDTMGFQQR